jgi:hypothetical protein
MLENDLPPTSRETEPEPAMILNSYPTVKP